MIWGFVKTTSLFAVITFVLGVSPPVLQAQDVKRNDPYQIPDDKVISYTKDIQPIFNKKCVSCHACFDSPAQLDLTQARGVLRGAHKVDPYQITLEPKQPHRLDHFPQSIDEYRRIGFFPVLEGGKDSILGKMLKLGYEHQWQPNERIPDYIEIDALKRRVFAPNAREMDGYAVAYPKQGMPFATAGLTAEEYATLMAWLEQGSKTDEVKAKPTPADAKMIARWEAFLNADDDRHKLVARYMYEHMAPFHFLFDEDSPNFYMFVRSSTPPGEEPAPIMTRKLTDGVEGPFYYRFNIIDFTIVAKRHILFRATGDKLNRFKEIFFGGEDGDWTVAELPGYSFATSHSPLVAFSAIPAKSRYIYLLEDALLYELTMSQGASCRSGANIGSVPERGWLLFENPETSLYVNDAEYRKAVTPLRGMIPPEQEDIGSIVAAYRDLTRRSREYRKKLGPKLKDGSLSRIEDIAKNVGYTLLRHDDNAETVPGLVGDYPERVMIHSLPLFERRLYLASANFDLFMPAKHMLNHRDDFSYARNETELNYLRFLPVEVRAEVFRDLNKGPYTEYRLAKDLPSLDYDIVTGIQYETDDPRKEFIDKVIAHVADAIPTEDPIARPKPGVKVDQVTKALQLIHREANRDGAKFKQLFPEMMALRIDSKDKEPSFFTLVLDWNLVSQYSIAGTLYHAPEKGKDKVTIYRGVAGNYPNFIFRIDEADIMEFAETLTAVDGMAAFLAVVDRWGVRRTNPEFWSVVHSITDYRARTRPREEGIVDVNRYVDF